MRGYFTAAGYYGLVEGRYVQFSCESDYYEYMEAQSEAGETRSKQRGAPRTAA